MNGATRGSPSGRCRLSDVKEICGGTQQTGEFKAYEEFQPI